MPNRSDLCRAIAHWAARLRGNPELLTDAAMEKAVGGEFQAFGLIERQILIHYGLQKNHRIVDVGCGSGRLAIPLSQWLEGEYLGTDVVAERVDYARKRTGRPDWRFEVTKGCHIPEESETVDFVCFFSVLTHLLHEHGFLYLEEAKRVLKPGGRIVLSFLEFKIPLHWDVFAETVAAARGEGERPLNVFLSRDALTTWAEHLGLVVQDIRDGDEPFLPLPHPIATESGAVMEKLGKLGQSICVLEKPWGVAESPPMVAAR